mgnify:CR=1 FL=1
MSLAHCVDCFGRRGGLYSGTVGREWAEVIVAVTTIAGLADGAGGMPGAGSGVDDRPASLAACGPGSWTGGGAEALVCLVAEAMVTTPHATEVARHPTLDDLTDSPSSRCCGIHQTPCQCGRAYGQ